MKETNGMNISFILPVYNVAPFLEDCIASISDQGLTVEQYEIICIDDCSTDDSYRKLHMLSSQYINMRILQNEKNSGVSFTRNRGIREAKGAYVWFVDPDDYIIKNAVEVTYTVAKKENADIVLGNYIRVAEQSIPGGDICQLMTYSAREVARPIDNMNRRMSAVWCGMFKRDFLVTNNLLFNENMIAQEDTLFYYQFEQCERKLVKLDAFIYCYRQRADSVMNVRTEAKRKGYYYAMREMLNVYNDMLKNRDIADSITLSKKIHHSKQNCANCLLTVDDRVFVKTELFQLKQLGNYPYPPRFDAFKGQGNIVRKFIYFTLPMEPLFWLWYYIIKITKKNK